LQDWFIYEVLAGIMKKQKWSILNCWEQNNLQKTTSYHSIGYAIPSHIDGDRKYTLFVLFLSSRFDWLCFKFFLIKFHKSWHRIICTIIRLLISLLLFYTFFFWYFIYSQKTNSFTLLLDGYACLQTKWLHSYNFRMVFILFLYFFSRYNTRLHYNNNF
jgi:hypothetical protein